MLLFTHIGVTEARRNEIRATSEREVNRSNNTKGRREEIAGSLAYMTSLTYKIF